MLLQESSRLDASSSEAIPAAIVQVFGVSKVVGAGDGSRTILFPTSFQIGRGEFVSIVGPSGSGKSTLLNLIGCLDAASTGSVVVDGTDTVAMSGRQLARIRNGTIGFVFQTPHLLPRSSALDNAALPLVYAGYGKAERRARAQSCLEQVGLHDKLLHRPDQLSGGQQQRVAIARALVTEPKIILADEPTGSLDSSSAGNVLQIFRELVRSGIAIAMVTHDEHIASTAQRRLQVHDGQVRELSAGAD